MPTLASLPFCKAHRAVLDDLEFSVSYPAIGLYLHATLYLTINLCLWSRLRPLSPSAVGQIEPGSGVSVNSEFFRCTLATYVLMGTFLIIVGS